MIDFKKLRREWKTFALGVVASVVGLYDAFTASNLDYTPIIPEHYRPYAPLVIGVLFLLLRQYRDYVVEKKDV